MRRAGVLGVLALAAGCREEVAVTGAAAGTAALGQGGGAAAAEELAARQREAVERAINPKGLPLYAGPVGAVRGVVRVAGDPAPVIREMIEKLPADACPRAHELQRKLFRQGVGGTLADALVSVTEYDGFVAPKSDAVRVEIQGCAFDRKVVAMTFGQRFDVFNLDAQAYMPRLLGTPTYTLRVAMPGGSPIPIFAPRPGRYRLVDETRDYVSADVFVLNYPTFDVTRLDGRFEIKDIPVGNVRVTAYAPAFGKVTEQRVAIEAGVTKELTFELTFSESEYRTKLGAQRDPSSGASGQAGAPAAPR